jgi:hypothetical protein
MNKAKRQGWFLDLSPEERRAFARHGEFAAHN